MGAELSGLIASLSYLGIIIVNAIVSGSVFFPIPGIVVITGAALLDFNPVLLALASAAGSMLGELVSYFAGLYGTKLASRMMSKGTRFVSFLQRNFSKRSGLLLFVWGMLPLPFDLIAIVAGSARYNVPGFLIYGFAGKTIRILVYIALALQGYDVMLDFFRRDT